MSDKNGNSVSVTEEEAQKGSRIFLLRQILIATGPFIITLVRGFTNAYSSTLIPSLKNENYTLTVDQEAWLASAVTLPAPIGAILGIVCVEKLGRRVSNLISCPLWCISWLIIYFAKDVETILIGRILCGIVVGVVVVPCVIFVAESSSPRYRGALLVTINLGITLGSLIIHTVGTFLSWEGTALFAALFVLPALVVLVFVPESPAWYCTKKRFDDARKSYRWTRGTSKTEEEELEKMIENANKENADLNSVVNQLKYLKSPVLLKPFGIFLIFATTLFWTGTQAIMFFSIAIAGETFEGLDEYITTLIMDSVRVVFSLLSVILGRYISRRMHLLVCTVGTGISLAVLAALLYVNETTKIDPIITFIIMLIYVSVSNVGLLSLIYVLIGELYPLMVRGLGQSMSNIAAALLSFSAVQAWPYMLEALGMAGTYVVYSCVAFLGAFILFFIMPETKAKTLLEIEENFK